MKIELLNAASLIIPSPHILVNVVSRRVRQLSLGHRPLVAPPPGMLSADIALTEIINKKLTYESVLGQGKEAESPVKLVTFPDSVPPMKKAA